MKKKWMQLWALMLACALLAAGCGGKREEAVTDPAQQETVLPENEEIAEEPEEPSIPLSVKSQENSKTYYLEDGETPYLYLNYCDVVVETSEYTDLKRNLENWSLRRSEALRNQHTTYLEYIGDDIPTEVFYGYSLGQNLINARVDERMVSLIEVTYEYTGGAHGLQYRDGINFDTKNGKKLALKDVIIDMETFHTEAVNHMIAELQENYADGLYPDFASVVEAIWENEQEPAWYFDANGLVIILQEYEVGPYAMGAPEIHFTYADYQQYIKDAYLPGDFEGIARLAKNEELFLTFSGAVEVPVMLKCEWQEYTTKASLWLGTQKILIGEISSLDDAYLVKHQDDVYCLVEIDMGSEDFVTYVYQLTENSAKRVAQIGASIDTTSINVNEIVMESWIYLLGTYGGIKTYRFDGLGNFATSDKEFLLHRNQYVLTTTADLPVEIAGEENVLPRGSHIVLNATDDESYVKFTITETGQTGVMEVRRGVDYYVTIYGMDERECFEELPYAG